MPALNFATPELALRRGLRVLLAALCKVALLLAVFQTPVDVSAKCPGEVETTEICKDFDTRSAQSTMRRQSVGTVATAWLLFPAAARGLRTEQLESPWTLHCGHTWANGLHAPLRL